MFPAPRHLSHDFQSILVRAERAGSVTQLEIFRCETAELCAGRRTIPLPTIYLDKLIVDLVDPFFENKQVTLKVYTRADAEFQNTQSIATWTEAEAQQLVLIHNLQPGDSLFNYWTTQYDDSACVLCAQGFICADYVE